MISVTRFATTTVAFIGMVGFSLGCGKKEAPPAEASASASAPVAAAGPVTLQGSGASFPAPLYSRWFREFGEKNKDIRVNYQSTGSGAGIKAFIAGQTDFGASDAAMTDEEIKEAKGNVILLPMTAGNIVLAYNLEGVSDLKLSRDVYAGIFLGTVKKWDDPKIAATNPGTKLPKLDISVVHRSDGSGTTFVFTDYLAQVSPEWKAGPGTGKSVNWPGGLGAKGNEGVAGSVKQTAGAIGYVELAYAMQNQLSMAALKNQSGAYVSPTVDATAAAAAGVAERVAGGDFRVSLNDAAGAATYPIATWTYLLVPPHWSDCGKAQAFVNLVDWALTQGAASARELHYAPLPDQVREGVRQKLGTVTCGTNNQPVKPTA